MISIKWRGYHNSFDKWIGKEKILNKIKDDRLYDKEFNGNILLINGKYYILVCNSNIENYAQIYTIINDIKFNLNIIKQSPELNIALLQFDNDSYNDNDININFNEYLEEDNFDMNMVHFNNLKSYDNKYDFKFCDIKEIKYVYTMPDIPHIQIKFISNEREINENKDINDFSECLIKNSKIIGMVTNYEKNSNILNVLPSYFIINYIKHELSTILIDYDCCNATDDNGEESCGLLVKGTFNIIYGNKINRLKSGDIITKIDDMKIFNGYIEIGNIGKLKPETYCLFKKNVVLEVYKIKGDNYMKTDVKCNLNNDIEFYRNIKYSNTNYYIYNSIIYAELTIDIIENIYKDITFDKVTLYKYIDNSYSPVFKPTIIIFNYLPSYNKKNILKKIVNINNSNYLNIISNKYNIKSFEEFKILLLRNKNIEYSYDGVNYYNV